MDWNGLVVLIIYVIRCAKVPHVYMHVDMNLLAFRVIKLELNEYKTGVQSENAKKCYENYPRDDTHDGQ